MNYILMCIILLLIGCTVQVSDTTSPEYCMADYRCSWYDYNGKLVSDWLCYEEIEPNMTCK